MNHMTFNDKNDDEITSFNLLDMFLKSIKHLRKNYNMVYSYIHITFVTVQRRNCVLKYFVETNHDSTR